ncbi:hypothetical protein AAFG13_41205 [Bradyrhizobium sp. B124]|uniref:hypothetical protein n=1 Tax=Bradyrhizobium sp. B124 TaxID=3140245 RepID=UPI003183ECE8
MDAANRLRVVCIDRRMFRSVSDLEAADLSILIRPDDAAEEINATRSIMQDIHLDLAECDNAIQIRNER